VCDHGIKPGGEDRLAYEPVGVRDVRDLEVGDEREARAGEVFRD